MNVPISDLPLWLLIVVGVLIVLEVALLAVALIAWVRTPEDGFSANRWMWLVIILAAQTIGPIVFLLFGRRPPTVEVPRTPPSGDATGRAVDLLYGERDG